MKNYYLLLLLGFGTAAFAQNISFTPTPFGGSAGICCAADMNGDYLDDIVTVNGGFNPSMTVYTQNTAGGFTATTYALPGLTTTPSWSIAAGDFDDNGFNDLVFGGGSRLTVIKNTGGTAFTEVSYPQNIFTQRTNFVDIDNDGNLDLWACHDVDQSYAYRNDGAGTLVWDTTLMPTADLPGNYATMWTDYDNDGDVDMYMAKCRGGAEIGDPARINVLYRNNGDDTYTEVGAAAGCNDMAQSWSTGIADYDNDGDMDFLDSNISETNKLYKNNGDGTFTDIYATTNIASQVGSWEIQAQDFNNDGFVDFMWENSKELYLNNGDMTFTGYDVSMTGLGSIGDFNNDGFLDMQNQGMVYYNSGNPNKWLKVTLQGVESNRNGIAARVEIYGAWGKQIREIRSGEGFSHMNSLNAHFGIGAATEIEKLIVRWPSGTVDVIMNPESNQTLFVLEGSSPELGISNSNQSQFSMFPIPAKDVLNFNVAEGTNLKSIQIFDLSGKTVLKTELETSSISVQKLASGTYVALLKDAEGNQYTQKFVKN